jgi:hypothetical protein
MVYVFFQFIKTPYDVPRDGELDASLFSLGFIGDYKQLIKTKVNSKGFYRCWS